MDDCPKCGYPTEIDYDLDEEPYMICTECGWYEEKEENNDASERAKAL